MSDLLDPSAASSPAHFDRRAEVRVGDHVTRYVRRGSGLPVVIVGSDGEPHALWAAIAAALADGVRLIVPEATVAPGGFVTWLRGFIEGIGVSSAVLIVGGAWCAPAMELQTSGAGELRALILAPSRDTDASTLRAAVTSRAEPDAVPTLWVDPDWPPAEAVRRIHKLIAAVST